MDNIWQPEMLKSIIPVYLFKLGKKFEGCFLMNPLNSSGINRQFVE
ncbi:MAG: hypothetical protein ABFD24_06450 [Anaerolineaceae bacterium]|jgi:hypothetical protein